MMNYQILSETVATKIRNLRNVQTVLSRPDFKKLYESASDAEKMRVDAFAKTGAYEPLRLWYRSRIRTELGDKSVRELREIAALLAIPDYTRLQKPLLLSEIVKRTNDEGGIDADDKIASR